jgi:threonine synthase
MLLLSTRGHGPVDLATALREGPAPDGGLYLPETLPRLPATGSDTADETFAGTAARVLSALLEAELAADEVDSLARAAFDFPVPLVPVGEDTWVLELTHGPTGAFKDVGARFLALALARLAPPRPGRSRTVLVATSGDTGGAVARAFHGLAGVRVVVLFPEGRVSALQRRQFTTPGGNVRALALSGSFDACQRVAREAFADPTLRARHDLTSANSLNVGRLLPQAAYYVHAARWLAAAGAERPPTFVVPSGNLGNLTAGVLAGCMDPGVGTFLAALNANDGFARVLEGGEAPSPSAAARATLSSAMDVARPSNLERLAYLAGGAPLGPALGIRARSVSDRATLERMARLERDHGYLADPHTAVGFEALARARAEGWLSGPAVVLATAHPAKFPDVVRRATGRDPDLPPSLAAVLEGREEVGRLAPELGALAAALDERDERT